MGRRSDRVAASGDGGSVGAAVTAAPELPPAADASDVAAFLANLPPDLIALIEAGALAFEHDEVGGFVVISRPDGRTFTIE